MINWNGNGESYLTAEERERVIRGEADGVGLGSLRRDDVGGIWLDFWDNTVEPRLVGHALQGAEAVAWDAKASERAANDIEAVEKEIAEEYERAEAALIAAREAEKARVAERIAELNARRERAMAALDRSTRSKQRRERAMAALDRSTDPTNPTEG